MIRKTLAIAIFLVERLWRRLAPASVDRQRISTRLLQAVVKLDPGQARAQHELGQALAEMGLFDKAVDCYEAALAAGRPASSGIYHHLGHALFRLGRTVESEAAFHRNIAVLPHAVWSYQGLGLALAAQTRFEEAEAILRAGLERAPANPWLHFHLGKVLVSQNRHQEAIELFIASGEIDPSGEAYFSRLCSPLLVAEASTTTNIKRVGSIVENHPDAEYPRMGLALLLSSTGKIDVACAQLRIAGRSRLKEMPRYARHYDEEMCLRPSFMIIGQTKAGTTSLYRYLLRHPQVVPALKKEIFFYSRYADYGLEWYLSHFLPVSNGKKLITGEGTPGYFTTPTAPAAIARHFPDIKLIALLRNPIDRAYSHYSMDVRLGKQNRTWDEVAEEELEQYSYLAEAADLETIAADPRKSYLLRSLIMPFLQNWLSSFPRQQLLLLPSQALFTQTDKTVNQVFSFLALPGHHERSYANANPGRYVPMAPSLRTRLETFFAPSQEALREWMQTYLDGNKIR